MTGTLSASKVFRGINPPKFICYKIDELTAEEYGLILGALMERKLWGNVGVDEHEMLTVMVEKLQATAKLGT